MLAIVRRAACIALALTAATARGGLADAGPLPWQDTAPTALPFLQLPFEAPATLAPGALALSLRTVYANSIASARSRAVVLEYRLETARPTAALRLGLAEGLELELAVPAVVERRGFLDAPIRAVEGWFATSNKLRRPGRVPQEVHFEMIRPGGAGARLAGPGEAPGDPWLGLKVRLRGGPGPVVSLRAALALPVARFPYGSGVAEGAIGLLAEAGTGRTRAWLDVDLAFPAGPVTRGRFATRPHPTLQAAVGRGLGDRVMLLLQASAHGSALRPLHLSEIDGWSFYVLAGARVQAAPGLSLGLGVIENVLVTERGTDIAGVLDAVYHW